MADNREVLLNLLKNSQQHGLVNNTIAANILADYLVNCLSGIRISAKAGVDRASCEAIAENSLKYLINCYITDGAAPNTFLNATEK